MDQQYVCPQCGEESDVQGPCPMCGLPMVPAHDDEDDSSFDESLDEEDVGVSDIGMDDDDDDDASYNPYEE